MKHIKILTLTLFTALALISTSWAYTKVMVLDKTPFAYQRLTVGTGTVFRLNANHRVIAGAVFITIETNDIRYRIDSGDPSPVNGHLVVADAYQNIWLTDRSSITEFRMIGSGGTAIVHITYYRKN